MRDFSIMALFRGELTLLLCVLSLVFRAGTCHADDPPIVGERALLELMRGFYQSLEDGNVQPGSFSFRSQVTSDNQKSDEIVIGTAVYSYPVAKIEFERFAGDRLSGAGKEGSLPTSIGVLYIGGDTVVIHNKTAKRYESYPLSMHGTDLCTYVLPWQVWTQARTGGRFSQYLNYGSLPPGYIAEVAVSRNGDEIKVLRKYAQANATSAITASLRFGGAITLLTSKQPSGEYMIRCTYDKIGSTVFLTRYQQTMDFGAGRDSKFELDISSFRVESHSASSSIFRPSVAGLPLGTTVTVIGKNSTNIRSYMVGGKQDPDQETILRALGKELRSSGVAAPE